MQIKRGQIWVVDLGDMGGSIQSFKRPMLVISNNLANFHSPVISMCPITSNTSKSKLPVHVSLGVDTGLLYPSIALIEQSMPINKENNILFQVGECSEEAMERVDKAIMVQFAISTDKNNMQYA